MEKKKDLTTATKQRLCLSCMECCKIVAVRAAINPENELTRSFYSARGCRILPTDHLPLVIIPFPCPNLTDTGCSIYGKRPLACQMYDGRNDPIMKHICLWGKMRMEDESETSG